MKALDVWLGKTLFHPPIISLCHLTRQSQYAIYRALWFFAACHATYYARDIGWGWAIFLWIWVMISFIGAVVFPDMEAKSHGFIRGLYWFFLSVNALAFISTGDVGNSLFRDVMVLFAEYATTIKTLPPRRTKAKQASAKGQVA